MGSNEVIVAALSRPFKLGMLYDVRTDQLLQGSALWDSAALQSMTWRRPQPHSDFRLSASDSITEKASLLEVQASVRASVLCGLVEAKGSAKFLHDKQQFTNQSRVTLHYKATTHFEQLSLTTGDWENVLNREMVEKGLATHVVTGIEYGANTFFVFDSHKLQASEVKKVKLVVKAVIHLLFWSINFEYNKDLTEEQKSVVEKLTVKFYSDLRLERSPASLIEAVQTYRDMTKLLGEHGQKSVPVRVWMMPLKHLSSRAAGFVRHISVGLVLEAEDALEELDSITMSCNDCLSVSAVGKFPELQQPVHHFYKLCHSYSVELRRQMAETCPAIREGTVSESVLRGLFNQRHESPFSHDRLTKWLEDKEREVSVVQSCLDIMEGIPVLSTQAEVDKFAMAPGDEIRWGFIFTSLGTTDAQLQEMSEYLNALKLGNPYQPEVQQSAAVPWFYNDEVVVKMRGRAVNYKNDKDKETEFITARNDPQYTGSATYKYQNGVQAEIDTFVSDQGRPVCLGFIFTSLQTPGSLLEEMERCLDELRMGRSYEETVQVSGQPWFYCDDTVTRMRAMAKAFSGTSGPVFIAAEHRVQPRGAAVVTYREGQLQD